MGNKVIREWTEFGHTFRIEKLGTPDAKGRGYRLYDNDQPALGGQWHYSKSNAEERAGYVLQISYSDRISYLEERVQVLERDLHHTLESLVLAQDKREW